MKRRLSWRFLAITAMLCIGAFAVQTLMSDAHAAPGNRKCPRGVQPCSAQQVGQQCDPNNPLMLCSAQANGSYCCLAYAP